MIMLGKRDQFTKLFRFVFFWEVVKFQIRLGSGDDKMFSSAHIFNSQDNKSEQRKLVVKGPLSIEWIFLADGRLF